MNDFSYSYFLITSNVFYVISWCSILRLTLLIYRLISVNSSTSKFERRFSYFALLCVIRLKRYVIFPRIRNCLFLFLYTKFCSMSFIYFRYNLTNHFESISLPGSFLIIKSDFIKALWYYYLVQI